jgi:hypothetical protein
VVAKTMRSSGDNPPPSTSTLPKPPSTGALALLKRLAPKPLAAVASDSKGLAPKSLADVGPKPLADVASDSNTQRPVRENAAMWRLPTAYADVC